MFTAKRKGYLRYTKCDIKNYMSEKGGGDPATLPLDPPLISRDKDVVEEDVERRHGA